MPFSRQLFPRQQEDQQQKKLVPATDPPQEEPGQPRVMSWDDVVGRPKSEPQQVKTWDQVVAKPTQPTPPPAADKPDQRQRPMTDRADVWRPMSLEAGQTIAADKQKKRVAAEKQRAIDAAPEMGVAEKISNTAGRFMLGGSSKALGLLSAAAGVGEGVSTKASKLAKAAWLLEKTRQGIDESIELDLPMSKDAVRADVEGTWWKSPSWIGEVGGQTAGDLAMTVGISIAATPAAGAAYAGTIAGAAARNNAYDMLESRKDLSEKEKQVRAAGIGAVVGSVSAITERVPLGFFKLNPRLGSAIARRSAAKIAGQKLVSGAGASVAEAGQESIEEVAERAANYTIGGDSNAFDGMGKSVAQAAFLGFMAAGATHGTKSAVEIPGDFLEASVGRSKAINSEIQRIVGEDGGREKLSALVAKKKPSRKDFEDAGFSKGLRLKSGERAKVATFYRYDAMSQWAEAAAQEETEDETTIKAASVELDKQEAGGAADPAAQQDIQQDVQQEQSPQDMIDQIPGEAEAGDAEGDLTTEDTAALADSTVKATEDSGPATEFKQNMYQTEALAKANVAASKPTRRLSITDQPLMDEAADSTKSFSDRVGSVEKLIQSGATNQEIMTTLSGMFSDRGELTDQDARLLQTFSRRGLPSLKEQGEAESVMAAHEFSVESIADKLLRAPSAEVGEAANASVPPVKVAYSQTTPTATITMPSGSKRETAIGPTAFEQHLTALDTAMQHRKAEGERLQALAESAPPGTTERALLEVMSSQASNGMPVSTQRQLSYVPSATKAQIDAVIKKFEITIGGDVDYKPIQTDVFESLAKNSKWKPLSKKESVLASSDDLGFDLTIGENATDSDRQLAGRAYEAKASAKRREIPDQLQRWLEHGRGFTSIQPNGVYTNPDAAESIYESMKSDQQDSGGTTKYIVTPNKNAKILHAFIGRREANEEIPCNSTGQAIVMMALPLNQALDLIHNSTNEQLVEKGEALGLDMSDVRKEVESKDEFGVKHESIVDAIGAKIARRAGFDAIWAPHSDLTGDDSEYVGLTNNAFNETMNIAIDANTPIGLVDVASVGDYRKESKMLKKRQRERYTTGLVKQTKTKPLVAETHEGPQPDGRRSRRTSENPARRDYYAKRRAERFQKRFGIGNEVGPPTPTPAEVLALPSIKDLRATAESANQAAQQTEQLSEFMLRQRSPEEIPVPKKLKRWQDPITDTLPSTKPAGLFMSPESFDEAYKDFRGNRKDDRENVKVRLTPNQDAKVLILGRESSSNNANWDAIDHFEGEGAAAELISPEGREWIAERMLQDKSIDPIIFVGKTDGQVAEIYGAYLTRGQGYDAIWSAHVLNEDMSQFVGLTNNAFNELKGEMEPAAADVAPVTPQEKALSVAAVTPEAVESQIKDEMADPDGEDADPDQWYSRDDPADADSDAAEQYEADNFEGQKADELDDEMTGEERKQLQSLVHGMDEVLPENVIDEIAEEDLTMEAGQKLSKKTAREATKKVDHAEGVKMKSDTDGQIEGLQGAMEASAEQTKEPPQDAEAVLKELGPDKLGMAFVAEAINDAFGSNQPFDIIQLQKFLGNIKLTLLLKTVSNLDESGALGEMGGKYYLEPEYRTKANLPDIAAGEAGSLVPRKIWDFLAGGGPETQAAIDGQDPVRILESWPARKMSQMAKSFAKGMRSRGGLPQEFFRAKLRQEFSVNTETKRAELAINHLNSALKSDFSIGSLEEIPPALLNKLNMILSPVQEAGEFAVRQEFSDVSKGLPSKTRDAARKLRDHVDSLSQVLIDGGMIEDALVAKIVENQGIYFNRSYKAFSDPDWDAKVSESVKNRYAHYLRKTFPTMTENQVTNEIASVLQNAKEAGGLYDLITSGRLGKINTASLKERLDLPWELKELLGVNHDARVNYLNSVVKTATMISQHKMLTDFRNTGLAAGLLYEANDPKIPEWASAEFTTVGENINNPLAGMKMDPTLKAEIESPTAHNLNPDFTQRMLSILMRAEGIAQITKTTLSSTAQVRQVWGNYLISLANGNGLGVLRAGAAPHKEVMADILGRSTEEVEANLLDAYQYGLAGESITANLVLNAFQSNTLQDMLSELGAGNESLRKARKAAMLPHKVYAATDTVFKLMNWKAERIKYREAFPEWSEERLKSYTAEIVRNTNPTYSMIPSVITALRTTPFALFASFPLESARNMYHRLRLASSEMLDPRTRVIGQQRFLGMMMAMAIPKGVSVAGALTFGGPDDDDIREHVSPWDKWADLLSIGTDGDGNPRYISLSYIDPMSYMSEIMNAFVRGRDWEDSLKNALMQGLEPILNRKLVSSFLLEVASNKNSSTGFDLVNPELPFADRMWEITKKGYYKAFEPGVMRFGRGISKSLRGEQSGGGKVYSFWEEMASGTLGIRVTTLNAKDSTKYATQQYQRDVGNDNRMVRRALNNSGVVPSEKIFEMYRKTEVARRGHFDGIQRRITSLRRIYPNMTDAEMVEQLMSGGIGRGQASELMKGVYHPYMPGDLAGLMRLRDAVPAPMKESINQSIQKKVGTAVYTASGPGGTEKSARDAQKAQAKLTALNVSRDGQAAALFTYWKREDERRFEQKHGRAAPASRIVLLTAARTRRLVKLGYSGEAIAEVFNKYSRQGAEQ